MNIALRQPMTLEQFLICEGRQELRWEFDGFQPVAMNGGTVEHSTIQINLLGALTSRLRGKPCRPHGSHLKIEVAGRIRYPDAFVVCTPVPPGAKVVAEPVVVFEILSPRTENEGLVVKNADHRATPSIQRYVILQQQQTGAMMFTRKGEDWVTELVTGDGAALQMPEIRVVIPLAELYADVEFPAAEDEPE